MIEARLNTICIKKPLPGAPGRGFPFHQPQLPYRYARLGTSRTNTCGSSSTGENSSLLPSSRQIARNQHVKQQHQCRPCIDLKTSFTSNFARTPGRSGKNMIYLYSAQRERQPHQDTFLIEGLLSFLVERLAFLWCIFGKGCPLSGVFGFKHNPPKRAHAMAAIWRKRRDGIDYARRIWSACWMANRSICSESIEFDLA